MLALLAGCTHGPAHDASLQGDIQVLEIGRARYLGSPDAPQQQACASWKLSPQQVLQFFRRSSSYSNNPYSSFYQVPCSISGSLEAEGRVWTFEINGGATAIWHAGDEVRYWGCSAEACDDLVLLPTDLMQPDATSVQR